MEIYFYTYEGLLEDKITIKSIGVWWYLSHKIYGKNNWYIFWVKICCLQLLQLFSVNR